MITFKKSHIKGIYCSDRGVSLVEVMVVVGIVATVVVGLLQIFIYCTASSDLSKNLVLAISEAETKLEEIRNHDFDLIVTDYVSGGTPGNTFTASQCNGKGIIYIDATNPLLLEIEIVISWRNNNNRIIGEDINLNGVLDSAEDLNSNGKLDSLATVASLIARR